MKHVFRGVLLASVLVSACSGDGEVDGGGGAGGANDAAGGGTGGDSATGSATQASTSQTTVGGGGAALSNEVCDVLCDCRSCSEGDRAACIRLQEDERTAAEAGGCGKEGDAYIACLRDESTCVDGQVNDAPCLVEGDRLAFCFNN